MLALQRSGSSVPPCRLLKAWLTIIGRLHQTMEPVTSTQGSVLLGCECNDFSPVMGHRMYDSLMRI